MNVWGAVLATASALAINEFTEVCPWAAQVIVRWSAELRYADEERRTTRAEELASLIEERPGKLFKLITAVCFSVTATWTWAKRLAENLQTVEAQTGAAGTVALTRALTVTVAAATAVALAATLTLVTGDLSGHGPGALPTLGVRSRLVTGVADDGPGLLAVGNPRLW